MIERRGFERLNIEGQIDFRPVEGSPESQGCLDNISFRGLAFYSSEKVEVGTTIDFRFRPRLIHDEIAGRAAVRHINELKNYGKQVFTLGIEFLEINTNLITHLIKRTKTKNTFVRKVKSTIDLPY